MNKSRLAAVVDVLADWMPTEVLIEHARTLGIVITLCRECSLPTFRPRYCSDKCSNRARQRDHYWQKKKELQDGVKRFEEYYAARRGFPHGVML